MAFVQIVQRSKTRFYFFLVVLARQSCPVYCGYYRPVCGSDGVTYHSECEVVKQQCEGKIDQGVEVIGRGRCEDLEEVFEVDIEEEESPFGVQAITAEDSDSRECPA